MTTADAAALERRRRHRRPRLAHHAGPLHRLRLRPALASGPPPTRPHPGHAPEPSPLSRQRIVSLGVALAIYAAGIGVLMIVSLLHPPQVEEKPLPVQLVKEAPPPRPVRSEAAPAPKALAERRNLDFAPAPQAVKPQVVNPRVVAPAAPVAPAPKLDPGAMLAPREIGRASAPVAEVVSAVSTTGAAQAAAIDVAQPSGPALRGPTQLDVPAGASAGPKQITSTGDTAGSGTQASAIAGSSMREGIASGRDVLGSPTGARVSSVSTRVGDSMMRGTGGDGTGSGGDDADCETRAEVVAYRAMIRDRVLARWVLPPDVPSSSVTLEFEIASSGSLLSVRAVGAGEHAASSSAADALRAAAPFPAVPERARCWLSGKVVATFRNTRG